MNHLFDDSWATLFLYLLYKPSFSTPWASFAHFSFREQEERLRVRVCLRFSRVERILCEFSRIFHLIEVCEVWKLFEVRKVKLLTPFSKHKAFFHQTSNFSFIKPHETNFSLWIVKTYFQSNLMKYISKSNDTCLFMIKPGNPFI